MFKVTIDNIFNDEDISVGKIYKITGEIRYGIKDEKIKELMSLVEQIENQSRSDVIVLDFTELQRWDSLGIRVVVPKILEINEHLIKKGRLPITVIGDSNSDLYSAMRDKYPDIPNSRFPWYDTFEDFVSMQII